MHGIVTFTGTRDAGSESWPVSGIFKQKRANQTKFPPYCPPTVFLADSGLAQ